MAPTRDTPTLLLPAGTRLVHIGPPKTGTTSIQSAFHTGRKAIAIEGVHYAGPNRQPVSPVLAVTGRRNPITDAPPSLRAWRGLVREVKRAGESRVVISSEFFADAQPDAIRTIVENLDPARVHIAITLRPLARIIPSQWQQYVQSGMRESFDAWLEAMFNEPASTLTPSFWFRHRHDRLVARWADVVGPQNVTVVALDDRDHAMVLRVFERLLGLREGLLVADDDLTNRSMTLPEIEVVRAFNSLFRAEGLGTPLHTKVMNFGAASYMKTRSPGPDEPRLDTPQWALDRAGEIAVEMVANIVASGVRVVGDPEGLTRVPVSGLGGTRQPESEISPQIASTAAMGVLIASGLVRGGSARIPLAPDAPEGSAPDPDAFVPRPTMEPLDLVRVSTRQLMAVLLRRGIAAAGARTSAVRRRIR